MGYEPLKRFGQAQSSDADLDRHFPDARYANEFFIGGIFDAGFSSLAEHRAASDEPEEGVGVQKNSHDEYS